MKSVAVDGRAVTFGTARRRWAGPQPNDGTTHPSTASVPIIVLLYNGPPLLWF